jgi:DNA repair exonuclease SbcCD nuclease subunit
MFKASSSSLYKIAMLHTNVDGRADHDNYAPCGKSDLIAAGMNYWALGHIHTRQILHTDPYIVYPGNIQGRSVKETGERGCYIVDVDEFGGTQLHFYELDSIRWYQQVISIEGMEEIQQLITALDSQTVQIRLSSQGRASVVRWIITGRSPLHKQLYDGTVLRDLLMDLRESEVDLLSDADYPFVWSETIQQQTGAQIDLDKLSREDSFIGELVRQAKELSLDSELGKMFAGQALEPLSGFTRLTEGLDLDNEQKQRIRLQRALETAIDLLQGDAG